jgi:hypothetical protein
MSVITYNCSVDVVLYCEVVLQSLLKLRLDKFCQYLSDLKTTRV